MTNTTIITRTNQTNNTNTNNSKGVITMTNTRTRKNSFKTRIIAGILSAITLFSVSSMAVTSASAETTVSDEFKDAMISAGIETADAAFDTVADLVPGGKILLAPFKSVFHTSVDDKDPMGDISDKLEKVDGKLDELDNKLTDLNKNINKNTQFMAAKIENTADMSELRSDFKGLSPQAAKLVKAAAFRKRAAAPMEARRQKVDVACCGLSHALYLPSPATALKTASAASLSAASEGRISVSAFARASDMVVAAWSLALATASATMTSASARKSRFALSVAAWAAERLSPMMRVASARAFPMISAASCSAAMTLWMMSFTATPRRRECPGHPWETRRPPTLRKGRGRG